MPNTVSMKNPTNRKAYIITGATSGIGRVTAFELAKYGTIILVGRDPKKLDEVQKTMEQRGQLAVSVVCDLSDLASVRRAAAEIIALDLPIVGLLNNAGIFPMRATKNALGWDNAFATNHIGPFVLTEALIPHLPDGANIVFIASGVEDPERKPAKMAGFRGGRYISAEASARGEWEPGGSKMPGADAVKRRVVGLTCVLPARASKIPFMQSRPILDHRQRHQRFRRGRSRSLDFGRQGRA